MKRVLLKLVAVFEIVSGLAGIYAAVAGLAGIAPAELAPMLWYGVFPLASVFADVLLWRLFKVCDRAFHCDPITSDSGLSDGKFLLEFEGSNEPLRQGNLVCWRRMPSAVCAGHKLSGAGCIDHLAFVQAGSANESRTFVFNSGAGQ